LILILVYTLLWFLAAFTLAILVNQMFPLPVSAFQCGLAGLIVGLMALLPTLQTERGRRLFYEGPGSGEDGDPRIGCLWLIPAEILLLTVLGWLIWLMAQLIAMFRK